jgi:hypothetical protein
MSTGCSHFSRVDFKYTSDAYLAPAARFRVVNAPSNAVAQLVTRFVAQEKGQIDSSESNLGFRLAPAPDAEEAWRVSRAIFEKEWYAFGQDDIGIYRAIDRSSPVANKPQVIKILEPNTGGAFVKATLAPRVGQAERSMTLTFTIKWKTDVEIETHLYVWWWPKPDGATLVYARAVPYMPKYKVEAAPGSWVQRNLWSATTGAADAQIVERLFAFLASGVSTPPVPS